MRSSLEASESYFSLRGGKATGGEEAVRRTCGDSENETRTEESSASDSPARPHGTREGGAKASPHP